jgi:DNA-binding transcriptional ArsR family regulator
LNDPWTDRSSYVDVVMARAMSHPLRAKILNVLNKRVTSPSRFSERYGVPLPSASYHFRELEKADLIELVHEIRRGNRTEHYYCAKRRALFDGRAWEDLPETIRNRLSAQTISDFLEVVAEAMRAETFDARVDRVLTWQRSYLDEQGWEEAADAHRESSKRFMEIERNSRIRLLRSGEKGSLGTSGMFLFESPLEEPEP